MKLTEKDCEESVTKGDRVRAGYGISERKKQRTGDDNDWVAGVVLKRERERVIERQRDRQIDC